MVNPITIFKPKGVFYNAIDIKEEEFYVTNFKEDVDNGILDKRNIILKLPFYLPEDYSKTRDIACY